MKKILCLIALISILTLSNARADVYDYIVDAGGGGDGTSIDTGSDTAGNNSTVLVKSGAYTETVSVTSSQQKIVFEPAVAITGGFDITGSNVIVVLGPGFSVSLEFDITTGTEVSIECHNGATFSRGIDVNSDNVYITGGGNGTVSDGGDIGLDAIAGDNGADYLIAENFSTASTSATNGFDFGGAYCAINTCQVRSSAKWGIVPRETCSAIGNTIRAATTFGFVSLDQARVIGNYSATVSTATTAPGEDYVYAGNILDGGMTVAVSADKGVIVGNRIDTTLTDSGSNTVKSGNDLTGF